MGRIGEQVGEKIAEKEYDVKVSLHKETHGPDGQFTRDSEPCILEVKSTADRSELGDYLGDAKKQLQGRNKAGIAISVYIDKDTGSFEYQHDFIPKTQGREGSGKPTAHQMQQQGSRTSNSEPKKESVDNSRTETGQDAREGAGKGMRQEQQINQQGSETVKGNERPASANSNSSRGVKDPDSKNVPSHRSGAE